MNVLSFKLEVFQDNEPIQCFDLASIFTKPVDYRYSYFDVQAFDEHVLITHRNKNELEANILDDNGLADYARS